MQMQKQNKYNSLISLSKPLSVPKSYKYATSIPSPKKPIRQFSFSLLSLEKEDDLSLIKNKFINKSKHSTSHFFSFKNPYFTRFKSKISSLDSNASLKNFLLLSSIEKSESNRSKKNSFIKSNYQSHKLLKNVLNKNKTKIVPYFLNQNSLSRKDSANTIKDKINRKITFTTLNSRKNSNDKKNDNKDNKKTTSHINFNILNQLNHKKTSSTAISSPIHSKYSYKLLKSQSKGDHNYSKNQTTHSSYANLPKDNNYSTNKTNCKKEKNNYYNKLNYKSIENNNNYLNKYESKIKLILNQNKKEIIKKRDNFIKNTKSNKASKLEVKRNIDNIIISKNSLVQDPTFSTHSSTNIDSNYYLMQSNKISQYIKTYYEKYKNYPKTELWFYKYGRLIGQGAFGKVNLGLNTLSGRVVAIKSFNMQNIEAEEESKKKILYETNLMKKLNHPSITKILEVFEKDKYILIIMEYINGGNLYSFVKKRRKIKEKTAKFLFKQIIQGIEYMHSKCIVHRDIKLENILIDLNNNIKICDFGIGKVLDPNKQTHILYDKCGTPMYIAPEILLSTVEKGYEPFPVDIWSAGVALYIMLSGALPFTVSYQSSKKLDDSKYNKNKLQWAIINNNPNPISDISLEAQDLLHGLLQKNPKKRLTIPQILNHPWIKEGKSNKERYHLFTKAEMIMLSKTYIDYRHAKFEDLKESFTLTNLISDDKAHSKMVKNIGTKSIILAPYNSIIENENEFINGTYISKLPIENNIILFSNKVREFNMNYELNNNGELDNGILISSGFEENNNVNTNNSYINNEEDKEQNQFKYDKVQSSKEKKEKILDIMEALGYDRHYVKESIKNNNLNHASAVYYLMYTYEHID